MTGKLSDVAGLVFLPFLLVATQEWVLALSSREHGVTRGTVWPLTAATAAGFVAIQVSGVAAHLYGHILGSAQWIPAAIWAIVTGDPVPPWQGWRTREAFRTCWSCPPA